MGDYPRQIQQSELSQWAAIAASRASPPQPARPASASGTASPAAPAHSPPSADPARSRDIWNVFTRPGAEQRIRRLLTVPGQPSLQHASRQLGIRNAILTSQRPYVADWMPATPDHIAKAKDDDSVPAGYTKVDKAG
jgi:hypothetical protein